MPCASERPKQEGQEQQQEQQQQQFPAGPLLLFAATWVTMITSIFMRGGRETSGLVPYCSPSYWLLLMLTAAALVCICLFSARRAIATQEASAAAAAQPPDSSASAEGFEWSRRGTAQIVVWSLLAGTLAAMCGIGGGMVMGPKLLDLGFMPQVQSATTATTLFVMSTSTCLAFLVEGAVPADYAMWLAFATGMGAVVGKAIVGWIVKRFRRPSVIMFLLAGIIITSVVVMFTTAIIDVSNDIKEGEDLSFRSPCGA